MRESEVTTQKHPVPKSFPCSTELTAILKGYEKDGTQELTCHLKFPLQSRRAHVVTPGAKISPAHLFTNHQRWLPHYSQDDSFTNYAPVSDEALISTLVSSYAHTHKVLLKMNKT